VAEVRAVIDRCILFLHTDLEYEWPKRKTLVDRFLQVLNLGRYKTGVVFDDDFHFWPFIRETDYLKASKRVSAS
jgi:hypothetical protein